MELGPAGLSVNTGLHGSSIGWTKRACGRRVASIRAFLEVIQVLEAAWQDGTWVSPCLAFRS